MKITTQTSLTQQRILEQVRVDVVGGFISLVWYYPDSSRRVVEIGTSYQEGDALIARVEKGNDWLDEPLVAGELTGKRIRVREGTRVTPLLGEDDLFDCDAECRRGEHDGCGNPVWAISLLGIEEGVLGTIGGILTRDGESKYLVVWDDGIHDGIEFSEAYSFYPLDQILAGAEVIA